MHNWVIKTLGDYVNNGEITIQTGPFGTQLKASDYVDSGIPVINVRNIGEGTIIDDNLEYITTETVSRLSSHVLETHDIVFGRKGAVDRHAFIQNRHAGWFQGSDCIRVRIKSPELLPRYVSYYLLLPSHKAWMINNCSHGATMASLNQDIIKRIALPVPDLKTQEKMISVISTYDDLINNNNRRSAVLREMAQRLYREWFLYFRFPGHEKIELMESELGMIPEGWGVKRFDQIAKFRKGKKAAVMFSENYGEYVKNILLDAVSSENYSFVLAEKMVLVEPTDTIMVMDGASSGKVIIGEDGAVGSTLAKIETSCEYKLFLYMVLANAEKEIMDNNTGSAIPHANKDFINMLKLIIPDSTLLKNFNSIVQPLFIEMRTLRYKNANLRKTRDLLLPRLVSGDIDISNSDILVREE
ncbi:restriction endonuclease subunit S [Ruminiclostridium cellobioparum]|uniref:restriction endonuclease subunit S n=1 Tax=Ruminiclostridium cellobioparum TaxID=29355 RepID=UPI0028ADBAFE|nr:restriction endonuclease subunit S [Ruminiclostridium cellobioparum]